MLYTPPKIAQDLGVPYHTLRRWVVTGRISGVTPLCQRKVVLLDGG
jgi:predicted site-specific integrase-resolvase